MRAIKCKQFLLSRDIVSIDRQCQLIIVKFKKEFLAVEISSCHTQFFLLILPSPTDRFDCGCILTAICYAHLLLLTLNKASLLTQCVQLDFRVILIVLYLKGRPVERLIIWLTISPSAFLSEWEENLFYYDILLLWLSTDHKKNEFSFIITRKAGSEDVSEALKQGNLVYKSAAFLKYWSLHLIHYRTSYIWPHDAY